MRHWFIGASTTLSVVFAVREASAVRPFVTDDARVVGERAAQVETWARFDRRGPQHWTVFGVGPVAPLEVSLGGVYGAQDKQLSVAGPLLQLKTLVHETKPGAIVPGLALVTGAFGPSAVGPLHGSSWDTFTYLAISESLTKDDGVLFHQNVGMFVSPSQHDASAHGPLAIGNRKGNLTWGVGTQMHLAKGLHFVGEVFSGDPYAATPTGACQLGLRHFISKIVQVDVTGGAGLWGTPSLPAFGSVGLRLASEPRLF